MTSFSLPPADWTYNVNDGGDDDDVTDVDQNSDVTVNLLAVHKNSDERSSAAHLTNLGSASSYTSNKSTDADQERESRGNRQTGDMQIYLYYVRSVGWGASLLFIIAIICFVFCISFPSK